MHSFIASRVVPPHTCDVCGYAVQQICGLSTPACGALWASATKTSSSPWTPPPSAATVAPLSTRIGRA